MSEKLKSQESFMSRPLRIKEKCHGRERDVAMDIWSLGVGVEKITHVKYLGSFCSTLLIVCETGDTLYLLTIPTLVTGL